MSTQSSKWHATRDARMKELFEGKKFTIVGEFKNEGPLTTPLGYKVKSGWHLAATDGSMECVVGKALLNKLVDTGAVEKPAPKKRGRPRKEQPIEQAEPWASRDISDDSQQITQAGPTYLNPNASQEAE
jgi:hypothetical protein